MLSNMAGSTKRFYQGYFILQDNLDEGLTGAILTRQIPYVDSRLSLWVKTKQSLPFLFQLEDSNEKKSDLE
jgi:hypothetical protein